MVSPPSSINPAWDDSEESWAESRGIDLAQALLLLLPALWLAWPAFPSPIAHDFVATELTATGAAALASLPAVLLLGVRALGGLSMRLGSVSLYLCVLGAALASALAATSEGSQLDALERTRALLWISTGWVQLLAGASLRASGRRALVVGACCISLLLMLTAFIGPAADGYAGALHNKGELSNAALAGALAGLALFALGKGPVRVLGALALTAFLVHSVLSAVLAGLAVVLLIGVGVAFFFLILGKERLAVPTLVTAAVLAGLGMAAVLIGPERESAKPTAERALPTLNTLGGMRVRRHIWNSTIQMVAAHPFLGVGPGQFAANFPPYRDPLEIELSTYDRRDGVESEVESPHDEYLLVLAEGGLLGAVAWLLFGVAVLRGLLRALRAPTPIHLALALGVSGLMLAALVNAPFSFNPPASVLGFAFLGALLTPEGRGSGMRERLIVVISCVGFALPAFAPGLRLTRHGTALGSIERGPRDSPHRMRLGVERALAACPNSVTALTLQARFLEGTGGTTEEIRLAWEEVIAVRPYRVEALIQLGSIHAHAEELEMARGYFERADLLDPKHPALMRNRARLELFTGDADLGHAHLERAALAGRLDALWLRDLGTDLLCRGLDLEAEAVLARSDARFVALDAQGSLQLANEYRAGGSAKAANGFECQSNRLWGREHARGMRWDDARRMFRQALRISRECTPGGARRIRLELAATMWHSNQREQAREQVAEIGLSAADWLALEPWTQEALIEIGLEPPN